MMSLLLHRRFLSFLGIGENVSNCAFIMHTAQDTFVAHVLQSEPNAGPLCKTIEAACKLRCADYANVYLSGGTNNDNEGSMY